MRGKIYGYAALVLCGVGIYLTGFACGEYQRHVSSSKMYFQGYRTGYIKGFRRLRQEFHQKTSIMTDPLKLRGQTQKAALDLVASETSVVRQN